MPWQLVGRNEIEARLKEVLLKKEIADRSYFSKRKVNYINVAQLLEIYESDFSLMRVKRGNKKLETLQNKKHIISTINRYLDSFKLSEVEPVTLSQNMKKSDVKKEFHLFLFTTNLLC